MPLVIRRTLRLIADAYERYERHGDLLAGSLAFFALLSLAPLVVIAISVASVIMDREEVQRGLIGALGNVASPAIVRQLTDLVDAIDLEQSGLGAMLAGFVLLFAASRLFMQLEQALNLIWSVQAEPAQSTRERVRRTVVKRLIAFAMVFACGVLLLSMLVVQAALAVVGAAASRVLGVELGVLGPPLVFFALLSLALGLVYRVLPSAEIQFRDVWVGAVTTAFLILLGTWLLGLYLTQIAPQWLQGAAGALAAFMMWFYYLAHVFLLGAAFTRAFAVRERRNATKPEEP